MGLVVWVSGSLSAIKNVASLPGSSDTICSSTPNISAADRVMDLKAWSYVNPHDKALIASSGRVLTCPSIG